MPDRCLVTGAQGFLGRWVTAALLAGDPGTTVVGVGRSRRASRHFSTQVSRGSQLVPAPLPPELWDVDGDARYDYRCADITSQEVLHAVLGDVQPDVVVHSAAALRDESWPDLISTNVAGTAAVVQALAGTAPPARLVLVSSGSVYGAAEQLPLREADHCRPLDPYAVTKHGAENLARVAAARSGVSLWTARVFNLLGPGLQERHLPAALAAQLTGMAVGSLPPHLNVGTLNTTRDLIDVRDAAAAVALLAGMQPPDGGSTIEGARHASGVVNVGSGRETPVQHVLDRLLAAVAARRPMPDLEQVRLPGRPADIPRVVADISRLAELGFRPRHDLDSSLQAMVDYYLEQVLR